MIKKILLNLFVVATFLTYSLHQRGETVAVVPIVADTSNTQTSTMMPSTTQMTSVMPANALYKDGSYTGTSEDAFYGFIQVKVVVSGGKITDVIFLDHPSDRRTSVEINTQAMPMLKAQTIKAQSSKVDGVSGATDTSMAFNLSLESALSQAKI